MSESVTLRYLTLFGVSLGSMFLGATAVNRYLKPDMVRCWPVAASRRRGGAWLRD